MRAEKAGTQRFFSSHIYPSPILDSFKSFVSTLQPPNYWSHSRYKKSNLVDITVPDIEVDTVRCSVVIKPEKDIIYCRKLSIFVQSEGRTLEEYFQTSHVRPLNRMWTYLATSFSFSENCLPYCVFRLRHIGLLMSIGVIAEMAYTDKGIEQRYNLFSLSEAMYAPPCYRGFLSEK